MITWFHSAVYKWYIGYGGWKNNDNLCMSFPFYGSSSYPGSSASQPV